MSEFSEAELEAAEKALSSSARKIEKARETLLKKQPPPKAQLTLASRNLGALRLALLLTKRELESFSGNSKGKIILLNGVSSSGKTTLAKFLQEQLPEPFYILSVDMFLNAVHDKFWKTDPIDTCLKAISGFHNTIKTFSDLGMNIIADTVFQKNLKSLDECVGLLHTYPVLFVHVTCPVDELRRREKARGDRAIGQAETQLPILDPQDTYDITVDTYYSTKEECAEQIMELFKEPDKFKAFKSLRSQQKNL